MGEGARKSSVKPGGAHDSAIGEAEMGPEELCNGTPLTSRRRMQNARRPGGTAAETYRAIQGHKLVAQGRIELSTT